MLALLAAAIWDDEAGTSLCDRLCTALCRTGPMRRALLVRHDELRSELIAAGGSGVGLARVRDRPVALWRAPLVRQVVEENRVLEARRATPALFPSGWCRVLGDGAISCVPLRAGQRTLGALVAVRDAEPCAGRSAVDERELHALGTAAALALATDAAASERERDRWRRARNALGRNIHERVIQRLFGAVAATGAETLDGEELGRVHAELAAALEELRALLSDALGSAADAPTRSFAEELEGLRVEYAHLNPRVDFEVAVPTALVALVRSVLGEALRNAGRHARPRTLEIRTRRRGGLFSLEVANDGVRQSRSREGVGLRIAALEAIEHGGVLDAGPTDRDRWRLRLLVPVDDAV